MDKDTLQSIGVNAATIGISFSGVEEALRITALSIGIIFTIYKFYITYRNEKGGINTDK